MIQQTACVQTKKDQDRSSGFHLRNAAVLVEKQSQVKWQASFDIIWD